ncbi:MAG: repressor LexA [endosymbiont of Galathealinum brachiosum]|uniref:LexA repressor n=1 Tax=endosymbiont of Galathealinum brachiosum TaxID=2200906 RepID=A0A370DMF7_9GAMM|nr:MAG: repressor LexA [endosymbiont of Galathealinum brachiosum]
MLTHSQQRTLDFIQAYILRNGHAPTYPEIAEGIGIQSQGTAHRYVKALLEMGYLLNEEGSHRGLRLPNDEMEQGMSIPLLGRIAAGQPIEAIAGHDGINLNQMFGGDNRYALKVDGESMVELGILDGDTVVIESCSTASKNSVIVALIDNYEVTLKIYRPLSHGRIKLIPANSSMEPMTYPADRVQIQGVLVGTLRTY